MAPRARRSTPLQRECGGAPPSDSPHLFQVPLQRRNPRLRLLRPRAEAVSLARQHSHHAVVALQGLARRAGTRLAGAAAAAAGGSVSRGRGGRGGAFCLEKILL